MIDDPELAPLRAHLHSLTEQFARRHDALLPWPEFLERFGLVADWNRSQRYFKRPELEPPFGEGTTVE